MRQRCVVHEERSAKTKNWEHHDKSPINWRVINIFRCARVCVRAKNRTGKRECVNRMDAAVVAAASVYASSKTAMVSIVMRRGFNGCQRSIYSCPCFIYLSNLSPAHRNYPACTLWSRHNNGYVSDVNNVNIYVPVKIRHNCLPWITYALLSQLRIWFIQGTLEFTN